MQPMPPPQAGGSVNIRKYDPKASKQAQQPVGGLSEKFLISPLTGEKIPVGSMESHMKIALLDPRWKEQKEKAIEEKRQQEQVFAEGKIFDFGILSLKMYEASHCLKFLMYLWMRYIEKFAVLTNLNFFCHTFL